MASEQVGKAWFDQPIDRLDSDSNKWCRYEPDVLPLWVADMDFRVPPAVIRALHERVEHGIFGYAKDPAELREAITNRLAERYAWKVSPKALVFLPGVITGFNLAIHTLALPDGAVLAQTPVYHPIYHAAENTGAIAQYNAMIRRPDGRYETDWQAFENDITPQTRLFLLCNPHNPLGRVFRRDELERYAEICLRKGVPICSDEIHCDLVFPGHPHTPIAALDPEISRHTITLMAPSKTFNLPGLFCSFAIIEDVELRKRYEAAGKGLISHVNLMGYQAALAAYCDSQEWERELLAYLQANRDFLADYVNNHLPGITLTAPEGTYLAWLDCRALELQPNPYEFFLQHARVALNDGAIFGPGGEGFVRLNFGCPRATLVEALGRIKTALQGG